MGTLSMEEKLNRLLDQQEIQELMAQYFNFCDAMWNKRRMDPDGVASLFIEDSIWECADTGIYCNGRENIGTLFRDFEKLPFVMHFISNPIIKIKGDVAIGYFNLISPSSDPETGEIITSYGKYDNEFIRTTDGWRIKVIRINLAIRSV